LDRVGVDRDLASWLVVQRRDIEGRLGPVLPAPDSAEAEALRRFRSFASAALLRGEAAAPALDGVRVAERRVTALLEAWIEAAASAAGDGRQGVHEALRPLLVRFSVALRATTTARRASGAPLPSSRRAVSAAIDRVADAFLAIDTETGRIEDANPAAGSLLGTTRDLLLGASALGFVPEEVRERWSSELDAMTEGDEPRRFRAALRDVRGHEVPVEATVTRFATRARTLALVLARPA
jgi:PAS domain S-box-containing protein